MQTDSANTPEHFDNRLLAALPEQDRRWILSHCDRVELRRGEMLGEPGGRISAVYFPTESFVSLVTPPADHTGLEVWLVGNEGMIGAPLVLGVDLTPLHSMVQGAGPAWRMSAEGFGEALRRSEALHRTLDRYLAVLMGQAAGMVACTRFHLVEERLARWLLMSRDRAHSNRFHVTHEVLAAMLGVRRAGVTRAAMALQQCRLIQYRRGQVTILDGAGLRAAACGCYGTVEAIYDRILV
ncbi:MAG: Crp/Fnr family transcriptional regulator [Thiohalocapsa sp.]|nr:Crp/Fnr family transcriptional regulator [Thiohalocapsa sp.]